MTDDERARARILMYMATAKDNQPPGSLPVNLDLMNRDLQLPVDDAFQIILALHNQGVITYKAIGSSLGLASLTQAGWREVNTLRRDQIGS